MRKFSRYWLLILFVLFTKQALFSQKGTYYRLDRYENIYFPLGRISFADRIVSYKIGDPPPIQKYRDSSQALHEPDYTNYRVPSFVSLGCGGELVVEFTDNGFMNLPGDDLYIFEVGPSREAARIEISEDGKKWVYAGTISGGKSAIDLSDEGSPTDIVYYFVKVIDLEQLCRSISAGADIDAIGAINSVIRITLEADVLFDVDKYEIKPTANSALDSLATEIRNVEAASLLIEGHTDSDGEEDYNMILSENRCLTVRDILIDKLGELERYDFEIIPYGESRPKVPNTSEENKQKNRRVEITVLPPKSYYNSLERK